MISFLFSDIICLFLVLLHIIYLREPAECAPISSPCKLFYFLAPGVAYLTNLTGLVDRSEGESDRSCSMSKATLVDLWPMYGLDNPRTPKLSRHFLREDEAPVLTYTRMRIASRTTQIK